MRQYHLTREPSHRLRCSHVSIWTSIKQFVKDSIVGSTSTHGGTAGGLGAHKKKRKRP